MINRFSGAGGKNKRIETLLKIASISGDRPLAELIDKGCKLSEVPKGTCIINQGDDGEEVYFILAGEVEIKMIGKERKVFRKAPVHVGEMSAITPNHPRSATITAKSDKVVMGVITGAKFCSAIELFPEFGKNVSGDVFERSRGWMQPNTEKSAFGSLSWLQTGGIASVITVLFASAFVAFFTANLAVATVAAAAITGVCFFMASISRAAVLWWLFMSSAVTTIGSVTPGLAAFFALDLPWLKAGAGIGGEPTNGMIIAMVLITFALLYAASSQSRSS